MFEVKVPVNYLSVFVSVCSCVSVAPGFVCCFCLQCPAAVLDGSKLKECSLGLLLVQPESEFCSIYLDSFSGFVWFLVDKYVLLIRLSKTQKESLA